MACPEGTEQERSSTQGSNRGDQAGTERLEDVQKRWLSSDFESIPSAGDPAQTPHRENLKRSEPLQDSMGQSMASLQTSDLMMTTPPRGSEKTTPGQAQRKRTLSSTRSLWSSSLLLNASQRSIQPEVNEQGIFILNLQQEDSSDNRSSSGLRTSSVSIEEKTKNTSCDSATEDDRTGRRLLQGSQPTVRDANGESSRQQQHRPRKHGDKSTTKSANRSSRNLNDEEILRRRIDKSTRDMVNPVAKGKEPSSGLMDEVEAALNLKGGKTRTVPRLSRSGLDKKRSDNLRQSTSLRDMGSRPESSVLKRTDRRSNRTMDRSDSTPDMSRPVSPRPSRSPERALTTERRNRRMEKRRCDSVPNMSRPDERRSQTPNQARTMPTESKDAGPSDVPNGDERRKHNRRNRQMTRCDSTPEMSRLSERRSKTNPQKPGDRSGSAARHTRPKETTEDIRAGLSRSRSSRSAAKPQDIRVTPARSQSVRWRSAKKERSNEGTSEDPHTNDARRTRLARRSSLGNMGPRRSRSTRSLLECTSRERRQARSRSRPKNVQRADSERDMGGRPRLGSKDMSDIQTERQVNSDGTETRKGPRRTAGVVLRGRSSNLTPATAANDPSDKNKTDEQARLSPTRQMSKNNIYEGIAGIEVTLTLHCGDDLAPKDRAYWIGKKCSSDPYVEVWKNLPTEMLARTDTIYKTLCPVFEETFHLKWTQKGLTRSLGHNHRAKVTLQVWDEDQLSSPDAMGNVEIPIPLPDEPLAFSERWISVDPDSARNAKGRLKVSLDVKYRKAPRLTAV